MCIYLFDMKLLLYLFLKNYIKTIMCIYLFDMKFYLFCNLKCGC